MAGVRFCICREFSYIKIGILPIFSYYHAPQNAAVCVDIVNCKGIDMNTNQLHEEIKEANLSYLLLAQQMINDDLAAATFRLGISQEMAELIARLTPAQLLKMAGSNMLLCRFRFDERLLLNMITDYTKDRLMSMPHAAIMMAGQPVEALAA